MCFDQSNLIMRVMTLSFIELLLINNDLQTIFAFGTHKVLLFL